MTPVSRQPKGRDGVLSTLDVFIQTLGLAKETCGVLPAQVALGSAVILLTMIRVHSIPPTLRGRTSDSRLLGYDGQRSGLPRSWTGLR